MTNAQHVVRRTRRTEAGLVALLEEVARAANESDSVEEAGRLTLEAVCRMTKWPVGHLCLPAPADPGTFVSSGVWAVSAGFDLTALRAETERAAFAPGDGLVGTVAATAAPAWSPDIESDPNFIRAR